MKISKETSELEYTIQQMNLADVYRIFHPTATEYSFFHQPMEFPTK
jgi:exonuclease III